MTFGNVCLSYGLPTPPQSHVRRWLVARDQLYLRKTSTSRQPLVSDSSPRQTWAQSSPLLGQDLDWRLNRWPRRPADSQVPECQVERRHWHSRHQCYSFRFVCMLWWSYDASVVPPPLDKRHWGPGHGDDTLTHLISRLGHKWERTNSTIKSNRYKG